MTAHLSYGTVRETERRAIHVLWVAGEVLEPPEIDDIAERLRERLAHRGEPTAEVVVVQADSRETLRFYGHPYSISRVRAALFNAAVTFAPMTL